MEVKIWDAASGALVRTFHEHADEVHSVAWSPEGSKLASMGGWNPVTIWEVDSGTKTATLDGNGYVTDGAWSPDGRFLCWGGQHKEGSKFTVWDVERQRVHMRAALSGKQKTVVAWRPESRTLAVGSGGRLTVWDIQTRRQIHNWKAHNHDLWALVWNPAGDRLASGAYTTEVKVWEAGTWKEQMRLSHDSGVASIDWSPDGRHFAVATYGQKVVVRDARSGANVRTFRGHVGKVKAVAWSPNGENLASAGADRTVKVWDTTTIVDEHVADADPNGVSPTDRESGLDAQRLISKGKYIVEKSEDGLTVRSAANPDEILVERTHSAIRLAEHRSRVAIGHGQTIEVWNLKTGKQELMWQTNRARIWSLKWSPDGDRLASGGFRGVVNIWDTESGSKLQTLEGHAAGHYISSLAWSADGKRLASGGWDETIVVWDTSTGSTQATLFGHTAAIRWLDWHPDGSRLASSDWHAETVKIWDTSSGQEMLTLKADGGGRLRWDVDGSRLLTGETSFDASRGIELSYGSTHEQYRAWRHFDRGYELARTQLTVAVAEFSKAIALQPEEPMFWLHFALVQLKLDHQEEALAACSRAIKILDSSQAIHPGRSSLALNSVAWLLATSSKEKRRDPALARDCASRAVELAPTWWKAWHTLGVAEYRVGNWTEAIDALTHCNTLIFGDRSILYQTTPFLVMAYSRLGDRQKASHFYEAMLSGTPGPDEELRRFHAETRELFRSEAGVVEEQLAVSNAMVLQGKWDVAIDAYRKILEVDPDHEVATNNLGVALLQKGSLDEAVRVFRKRIAINPKSATSQYLLGLTLEKQGTQAAAIDAYSNAVELDPKDPLYASCVAWLLATAADDQARDPERAVQLAKEACQLEPETGEYWKTLGVAHYRAGDWQEALDALRKSRNVSDGDGRTSWFHVAMSHWKLGQQDEARRWYETGIAWMAEHDSDDEELLRFRWEAARLLGIEEELMLPHKTTTGR